MHDVNYNHTLPCPLKIVLNNKIDMVIYPGEGGGRVRKGTVFSAALMKGDLCRGLCKMKDAIIAAIFDCSDLKGKQKRIREF